MRHRTDTSLRTEANWGGSKSVWRPALWTECRTDNLLVFTRPHRGGLGLPAADRCKQPLSADPGLLVQSSRPPWSFYEPSQPQTFWKSPVFCYFVSLLQDIKLKNMAGKHESGFSKVIYLACVYLHSAFLHTHSALHFMFGSLV